MSSGRAQAATQERGLRSTFAAFEAPWYRSFWAARALSSVAFQFRGVVRGWLIYELTGSAFILNAVNASWSVATFVFSAPGGVISDRFDRRKVILLGQAASVIAFLGVAALIATGAIQVWHLAASSLILGLTFSFVIPARMALLSDLMPREALLNAVALSMVGMGVVGVFSSTLGGILLERAGAAPVYLVMALMYAITLVIYFGLPTPTRGKIRRSSMKADLIEGGRYMRAKPELMAMMGLELFRVILYMPYMSLLPVFAADVFDSGAVGLGLLRGASALGGMLGSLLVASLGDVKRKGLLLIGSGALAGLGLILLGRAPTLAVAMPAVLLATLMSNAYMVTRSTLVQSVSSRAMRGRMTGFSRLMFGLMPLGTLPSGAMADRFGAPLTVTIMGVSIALVFVLMGLLQPRLRTLQDAEEAD